MDAAFPKQLGPLIWNLAKPTGNAYRRISRQGEGTGGEGVLLHARCLFFVVVLHDIRHAGELKIRFFFVR